jgi:hypothetical protein
LIGDYLGHLCAQELAGSNAIFTGAGGVAAMAAVAAGPLAGLVTGVSLVGWLALRAPYRLSFSSPVRMYGGFDEAESGEVFVSLEDDALVVRRDEEVQRVALRDVAGAEVDGEYVTVRVPGEASPLVLRAIGDEHADREKRVALVSTMAQRLGSGR